MRKFLSILCMETFFVASFYAPSDVELVTIISAWYTLECESHFTTKIITWRIVSQSLRVAQEKKRENTKKQVVFTMYVILDALFIPFVFFTVLFSLVHLVSWEIFKCTCVYKRESASNCWVEFLNFHTQSINQLMAAL